MYTLLLRESRAEGRDRVKEQTERFAARRLLAWLPALLAVCGLFYLTCQSPQDTLALSGGFRQWLTAFLGLTPDMHWLRSLAHVPQFFVLAVCFYIGWHSLSAHPAQCTLATCAALGLADEGLKFFLPTREFDIVDWCLDLAGAALAVGLLTGIVTIRKRMKASHV